MPFKTLITVNQDTKVIPRGPKLEIVLLGIVLDSSGAEEPAKLPVQYHLDKLAETGWTGKFEKVPIQNGFVVLDSESNHFKYAESPSGCRRMFFGGYSSVKPEWLSDEMNTIEDEDTWGEFAAVICSEVEINQSVKIFSGLSGSWPIYFGNREQRFCASNDPQFVAVAMGFTEMDLSGSYELLTYGHTVGESSTISGVHKLPAGHRISVNFFTDKTLSVEILNGSSVNEYKISPKSTQNAYRALISSIKDSEFLSRGLADGIVQISGGLDSRLTAAALREACEVPPKQALTMNLSNKEEIQVSSQVALALGYDHTILNLNLNDYQDVVRDGWLLTGGQVAIHAAAGNLLGLPKESKWSDVQVIGGWPGDCLIGGYVVDTPLMTRKRLTKLGIHRWAHMRETPLKDNGLSIHPDRASKTLLKRARNTLIESTLIASGNTAGQKISHWGMYNRQPSFSYVSPSVLTSNVLSVTPLLSRPYLRELLSLDIDDLVHKNFYRLLFTNHLPEMAKITYANSALQLNGEYLARSWIPKTRGEALYLLPSWVVSLVSKVRREFIKIWQIRPDPQELQVSEEELFWIERFQKEGFDNKLEFNGVVFEIQGKPSLQLASRFIALLKTAKHLKCANRQASGSQL